MSKNKYNYEKLSAQIISLIKQGVEPKWYPLSEKLGIPRSTLRDGFKREMGIKNPIEITGVKTIEPEHRSLYQVDKDGTVTSDRLIEIMLIDMKDERAVLEAHGFDPDKWVIEAYRHNYWHGLRPDDRGQIVNCQSRITAKPKRPGDINFADIDNYFEKYSGPIMPSIVPRKNSNEGDLLEVVLADIHSGNVPYKDPEKTLKEKLDEVVGDISGRAKDKKFCEIYLVLLGDIVNYDNPGDKTTYNGTKVASSDITPPQLFDKTVEYLKSVIVSLEKITKVKVIFIPGNHDPNFCYFIVKTLENFFRLNDNITFDNRHDERKWFKFGKVLVGLAHGDMLKKYAANWLQNEAREEWGETEYSEIHLGHIHHEEMPDPKGGAKVRYLPTLAERDKWHYRKGYPGDTPTTVSFVWNKEKGLREIWYSNV